MKYLFTNRKILALFLLPVVAFGIYYVYQKANVNTIYGADPLEITYNGDTPTDPMFDVQNMLPGDEEVKDFKVKNNNPGPFEVMMSTEKKDGLKNFEDILDIEISYMSGPTVIFTGKLKDLFASPAISLGTFAAGEEKTFSVEVKFPFEADNEWQEAMVKFNIIWEIKQPPIELPAECKDLEGKVTSVIEGTEGADRIKGTEAGELIIAKGSEDKVDGGAGDDCIVGGFGSDKLEGGEGNDIILAGDGNDHIDAGAGKDLIYTGEGNDHVDAGAGDDLVYAGTGNNKIDGGSGRDLIYAYGGNDQVDGGSDDDVIYGGDGNDKLEGSSGDDYLYGEAGNDDMRGDSGDDFLDGGIDHDDLRGNSGTDTCTNGEVLSSCEL